MMQYKECLFFVAKCLTLDQYPTRIAEMKDTINSGAVDWDRVVKVGDGQFVLPAMYLQLERAGLRALLPDGLDEHLGEITALNRERNLAILDQAKKITDILHQNQIAPIFLKGVAHLLSVVYTDIAERIIGDIDLLVPSDQLVKAGELLIEEGYIPFTAYKTEAASELKNFPRLHDKNFPAPVEIHQELLYHRHRNAFRGTDFLREKIPVTAWRNKAFVPSDDNMIIHNVFNVQFNDNAYNNCTIFLRQMYDLKLLSFKTDHLKIARSYGKKFQVFNSYFAATNYVFSNPAAIRYNRTLHARLYIIKLDYFLTHYKAHRKYRRMKNIFSRINRYFSVIIVSFYNKETRLYLIKRLKNREYYNAQIRSWKGFYRLL